MRLIIVIPAYNEAEVLGSVLKKIPRKLKGIRNLQTVVVNDGSNDQTAEIAKKNKAKVISHLINLGVGAATITGIEYARMQNADVVVTLDADGQHSPKDIAAVVAPIVAGDADLVIGSRVRCVGDDCNMPWIKRVGNFIMNGVTFVFYRKWISDTQSGFKALSKKALQEIKLSLSGYEICSEIIGEAARARLEITEIPVQAIYTEYSKQKGQSIFNSINILIRLISKAIFGP